MSEARALGTWYEQAGVRRDPRRITGGEPGAFFPAHLVPHLSHPLVVEQSEALQEYLAAQHLYQWLNFTADFEVAVVVRATRSIVDGTSGVHVARAGRRDAMKICVDENYHALYSVDVVDQVAGTYGIEPLDYRFGPFLARLDAVGDGYPEHRRLVQLLQVVVFETLITSLLNDIPRDPAVIPIVRDVVQDHATDEAYHHAYFARFFRELWAQLDGSDRRTVARLLPHVIVESLQPATRPARAALGHAGFSDKSVTQIVAESYADKSVMDGINFASRKTVALFERCGVLDVPGGRDEFHSAGFTNIA